ncbi:hypothetical protein L915_05771, partial [Phytophthora nicotianae]
RNFIIWMTRVTAALDGKNLLGFVTRAYYAGDSDPEFSDDDDLDPALFDEDQAVRETLGEIGAPRADPSEGSSSSESSESNSTASDAGGDVEKTQGNLSVVKTLASTKQDEHKRVEKLKAKRNNAELKSTSPHGSKSEGVPDHKPSATNMCSCKYECAAVHGDPYYIQSYLMTMKYEEGTDLTAFIFEVEQAMKALPKPPTAS